MAGPGKLAIHVTWDGSTISRVDVISTRPQASRLLKGMTPEQALAVVPQLFSLCGNAQAAAAQGAMAAAAGSEWPQREDLQRRVVCEALQEHLWRLLLDWPDALGLPADRENFVRWHAMLRRIAASGEELPELAGEIGRNWLGMNCSTWLGKASYADLQDWWLEQDSPAARLFAELERQEQAPSREAALLPAVTAQAVMAQLGRMDEAYAAMPSWAGRPAETGMLARHLHMPWLQELRQTRPFSLLARVLARAYDMVSAVCGRQGLHVDHAGDGKGNGLGLAHTARGLLMHQVRLAAGRVADYCIVAPTEWNFHPYGALVQALQGNRVTDEAALHKLVRRWVLALDPCVACEMELYRA